MAAQPDTIKFFILKLFVNIYIYNIDHLYNTTELNIGALHLFARGFLEGGDVVSLGGEVIAWR